jgi:hypothetical protein
VNRWIPGAALLAAMAVASGASLSACNLIVGNEAAETIIGEDASAGDALRTEDQSAQPAPDAAPDTAPDALHDAGHEAAAPDASPDAGADAGCTGCLQAGKCVQRAFPTCGAPGESCESCSDKSDRCGANGRCACGNVAPCAAGQRCKDGSCVCDPASCPNGCCHNNACVVPAYPTCGPTGGLACEVCDDKSDRCRPSDGKCSCGNTRGPCRSAGDKCSFGDCI